MSSLATHPRYRTSIDMGSVFVWVLAFSPDSRYLAVGDAASSAIVIRDLQLNREQTRIDVKEHDIFGGPKHLHWGQDENILWSPDGRYITNGIGVNKPAINSKTPDYIKPMTFWDPLTGQIKHELSVGAMDTSLNRDGSKLVTRTLGKDKYVDQFCAYDTNTWQRKELDISGILIAGLSWTADDKIFVVGTNSLGGGKGNDLRAQNGALVKKHASVACLVDPTGKEETSLEILADPKPNENKNDPSHPFIKSLSFDRSLPDFKGAKIAVRYTDGGGFIVRMLDSKTLQTLFIHRDPDALVGNGHHGISFSPDGKYLYLLAHDPHDREANSIVLNATTGEQVGTFPSKSSEGLAISPDGKTMAVGHGHEIQLFDLQ